MQSVMSALKKGFVSDCPEVNILLIVIPVIGGVVLIGIIALIIWKILQTIRDRHEYRRFLLETNNPKWAKVRFALKLISRVIQFKKIIR